jgi:hypothetical protein
VSAKPATPPKVEFKNSKLDRVQNWLDGTTAWLDRLPLWVWLVICWLMCGLAVQLLPVFWSANDDIAMANLANGRLTGTNEWQLVFINPLWGLLLKGLYLAMPGVSWYPVLFVMMHGFGWALFFRTAGLLSFGWQKWAWAALIWIGLSFYTLLQLQFTTVAGFAAVSSLLFVAAQVRWSSGPAQVLRQAWPALLCFCLCWLIRKEILFLLLPIITPLFLWLVLTEKRVIRKLLVLGAVLAVFCAGALVADRLSYARPEWQRYRQFNYTRGNVQDSKPVQYQAAGDIMKELGWSRNDYDIFYHFRQDRTEQFGPGAIEKLFEAKGTLSDPEILQVKIAKEWKDIQERGFAWSRFGLLAVMLLALGARRKQDIAGILGTIVFAVGVAAAFIMVLILKDRVFACLLFETVAACFFLRFYTGQKRSGLQLGLLGVGAVLALLSAKATMSQGLAELRELKPHYAYIRKMKASSAVNPVIDFYSGSLAVNDPFGHYKLPVAYHALSPIPIGWLSYSPFQAKAMRRMGYKPDSGLFLQAAADPRATFLLDPLTGPLLLKYLQEHGRQDVRFVPTGNDWNWKTDRAVQYRVLTGAQ